MKVRTNINTGEPFVDCEVLIWSRSSRVRGWGSHSKCYRVATKLVTLDEFGETTQVAMCSLHAAGAKRSNTPPTSVEDLVLPEVSE